MEHSTSLCPEETAGYLKFIIDLSETCMNTCGILEKRSISNASHIDKFDTECLESCAKSYMKIQRSFSENFSELFLKGNPFLGNNEVQGGFEGGEFKTENADGLLE